MEYGTYILTAFETEIERNFNTKKEMINYLSTDLFASKDSKSISVVAFSIDKDGDKKIINTKNSREGRS